jgi:hypothetical protein
VIPGIVNTFIGLFKDTTLVLIIGLFDLLGQIQSSMNDPELVVTVQSLATGFSSQRSSSSSSASACRATPCFMERKLWTPVTNDNRKLHQWLTTKQQSATRSASPTLEDDGVGHRCRDRAYRT